MGKVVLEYVREIFDADDVLHQLRTVQYVVTHLETFPVARARATCERARFFGNFTYRGVKKILRDGLDLEPLPDRRPSANGGPPSRYARPPEELLPFMGGGR